MSSVNLDSNFLRDFEENFKFLKDVDGWKFDHTPGIKSFLVLTHSLRPIPSESESKESLDRTRSAIPEQSGTRTPPEVQQQLKELRGTLDEAALDRVKQNLTGMKEAEAKRIESKDRYIKALEKKS